MDFQQDEIPGVTDDPVLRLILSGRARTLDEAEEIYLDASMPEVLELLRGTIPDEELARHPLMKLLRFRGSRGREDSILQMRRAGSPLRLRTGSTRQRRARREVHEP
jgi:hypothetical protein